MISINIIEYGDIYSGFLKNLTQWLKKNKKA